MTMAAQFSSTHHNANRAASATAACTSARFVDIMDTAIILAVSIIMLSVRLRLF
jgi:hypothetical protein